jgi:glycosyltransferase involved in cell wall biosynthesis
MRIFSWTSNAPGLDRIRVQLPLDELARHGHEVGFTHIFEREHGDADTIVGCRIAKPKPSKLWTHACGMLGGPFCVFETDDDNLGISRYNKYGPYQFWGIPEHRFFYLSNLRVSHRIVTSTPYLQQLLYEQTGHPDIVVAPNAIPAWLPELPLVSQETEQVTVGWAGGTSHEGDWEWVKSGVSRAVRMLPQTKLRFVGSDYRPKMKLPAERMEHTEWVQDVDTYWRQGLDFQVGLAPLRPEMFNRAKSEIKLMEYAARGVATVASDYGPYADFIEDGVDGLLVRKPRDWTDAIEFLVKDPQARQRMVRNAHAKVRHHTIEHLWPAYEEAFTP